MERRRSIGAVAEAKMDQDTTGLIGGIGGSVLGILGGVVGTWFSIKNTNGPRERAFMIRVSALSWLAVAAFLTALWFTPLSYQPLLWLPVMPLLYVAARAGNRRQDQIRKEESGARG